MENDIKKYFFDILESIHIIESHLNNIPDYLNFSKNLLVQDAVQRRLAIIGEAIWKAHKLDSSISITNIKNIISFRHILIHDYDKVEMATIWIVVTRSLLILKQEIEFLLKN